MPAKHQAKLSQPIFHEPIFSEGQPLPSPTGFETKHPSDTKTYDEVEKLLKKDVVGVPGSRIADDDLFRDRVDDPSPARPRLVLIRAGDEPDVARAQVDELVADCGRRGVPVSELMAEDAAGPVGRLASVLALLDFTAAYLGIAGADGEGG